jgi:hypothetical protein
VLHFTCHVIVIRSLPQNVSQSDTSLSIPSKWQRWSAVMQTLLYPSVWSNHMAFVTIQTLQWFSVSSNHLQFVVRTYAFNNLNLASTTHLLLWAYIKTCPPTMHLHTSLTHYRFPHALPSWTCLVTWSLHGTSIHSAVVVSEQSLPPLLCRAHMEGDVGCVLTLTQVAL